MSKDWKPATPKEDQQDLPEKAQAPLTIMSPNDAYIAERMKEQPQSLEDIQVLPKDEKVGTHRLSLPDYFEPLSYDCTQGNTCPHHWCERS